MQTVIPAGGAILDRVLETTWPIWGEGLSRQAYGQLHAARMQTGWARRHQRSVALVDGLNLLASATHYTFDGMLDGKPVRICGVGSVFTQTTERGRGVARALVERLLSDAARDGAAMGLLFGAHPDGAAWRGFEVVPTSAVRVAVAEPLRRGAPMTMIRSGQERDLEAIVSMGRVRAAACRFHLDRDVDFVQHAIARKRLLAGLGAAGRRQFQFFIAEEGITAAAYVILSIEGDDWTVEECGDRDPTGARVGAMLQALIAREPSVSRPIIRAWLPAGFAPPQLTITPTTTTETVLARRLDPPRKSLRLAGGDALYWLSDLF